MSFWVFILGTKYIYLWLEVRSLSVNLLENPLTAYKKCQQPSTARQKTHSTAATSRNIRKKFETSPKTFHPSSTWRRLSDENPMGTGSVERRAQTDFQISFGISIRCAPRRSSRYWPGNFPVANGRSSQRALPLENVSLQMRDGGDFFLVADWDYLGNNKWANGSSKYNRLRVNMIRCCHNFYVKILLTSCQS